MDIDQHVKMMTDATNDLFDKIHALVELELKKFPDTPEGFRSEHLIMQGVILRMILNLADQVKTSERLLFIQVFSHRIKELATIYLQMGTIYGQEDQKD